MPGKPAKLTAPPWRERKSDSSRQTDRQGAEKAREAKRNTENLKQNDWETAVWGWGETAEREGEMHRKGPSSGL